MKITGHESNYGQPNGINKNLKVSNASINSPKEEKRVKDNSFPYELSEDARKKLQKKIDELNNIISFLDKDISFKLHDQTERLMTQVINLETREVIKEIPPEEMLDLIARIHKMVGILIDEKV